MSHSTPAASPFLEQIQRLPWNEITDAQAAGTWTQTDWPGTDGSVDVMATDVSGAQAITTTYTVDWRVNDVLDGGGTPSPCCAEMAGLTSIVIIATKAHRVAKSFVMSSVP